MMEEKIKLKEEVLNGARKRWGALSPEIIERIDYELDCFEKAAAVTYMLMCADVVDEIRRSGGYIGPGRGACTGSVVCYALGVTNVDPTKYDLLFERFMRPERIMSPAVSIDTDEIGEKAARKLLERKYGAVLDQGGRKEMSWPNIYEIGDSDIICMTGTAEVEQIKNTLKLIEEKRNVEVDMDSIRDDDQEALKLFWEGATDDIPFFDSPDMKDMLRRSHGPRFKDLVAMFGLLEHGLEKTREEFLNARLQGGRYIHPILGRVLGETYGVLLYQEQLMSIARCLAGFSPTDADKLRTGLGKGYVDVVEKMRPKFLHGCLQNKEFRVGEFEDEVVATACAKDIWNELCRKGEHCCQKAHCVAWTTISYQLAYLKVHYPGPSKIVPV